MTSNIFLWCSFCRAYHLKRNRHTIRNRNEIRNCSPNVINFRNFSHDTGVHVTLVSRFLQLPVAQKFCRCEHAVITSRKSVDSRTLLHEAFNSAYCDRLPNKKTVHRRVKNFRTQEMFTTGNMSGAEQFWQVLRSVALKALDRSPWKLLRRLSLQTEVSGLHFEWYSLHKAM
jgi:hypothetical protein